MRGVLRTPPAGLHVEQRPPDPRLAPYVAIIWSVEWDLEAPYTQSTLPFPAGHVVLEGDGPWLYGPPTARFDRVLAGRGSVLGARFTPGGLRPLVDRPMKALRDARVPAHDLVPTGDLEADLLARLPAEPPESVALAARAVELLQDDRSLTRVDALAKALHLSVRSVQRLFAEHIGVGPAWVVRRFRLQEAAEAATSGDPVDWAALAAELGYYDQAHLVREFTAAVGTSPNRYATG